MAKPKIAETDKLIIFNKEFDLWIEENIKPLYKTKTKSYYQYTIEIRDGLVVYNPPKSKVETLEKMYYEYKNLLLKHEITPTIKFVKLFKACINEDDYSDRVILDNTVLDDYLRSAFDDFKDLEITYIKYNYSYDLSNFHIEVEFELQENQTTYLRNFNENKNNFGFGIKFIEAIKRFYFVELNTKQFKYNIISLEPYSVIFKIRNLI